MDGVFTRPWPAGCIIFACHKVNDIRRDASHPNTTSSQTYNPQNLAIQTTGQFYDPANTQYPMAPAQYTAYPVNSQSQSWGPVASSSLAGQYAQWQPAQAMGVQQAQSHPHRSAESYPAMSSSNWSPTSTYLEGVSPLSSEYSQSMSSPQYTYTAEGGTDGGSSNEGDGVPLSRGIPRRTSPGSTKDQYGASARGGGNPPIGVPRCSSCKATQSPEWRKGPSGKKDLCNAYVPWTLFYTSRWLNLGLPPQMRPALCALPGQTRGRRSCPPEEAVGAGGQTRRHVIVAAALCCLVTCDVCAAIGIDSIAVTPFPSHGAGLSRTK
jgi:hypothetical protein